MRLPAGPCWAWTMLRTVGECHSLIFLPTCHFFDPLLPREQTGDQNGLVGGGFTSLFCYSEEDVLDFT